MQAVTIELRAVISRCGRVRHSSFRRPSWNRKQASRRLHLHKARRRRFRTATTPGESYLLLKSNTTAETFRWTRPFTTELASRRDGHTVSWTFIPAKTVIP